ncbi:uncharacterized protein LOC129614000 [Condylostylus longicornis]|uniref:uncharacterized protein LOC129614000 n=1 Tax=Condylostylus longicornis TaxID=2530218 RepID=UPI00244DB9F1|nr:uncharacterized protein LOC129614000 [Condylostylus longicornis]
MKYCNQLIIKMIPIFLQLLLISFVYGQRPSFAGSLQHSGYKDKLKPETNITVPDGLSERFEQDLLSNRTQRPPVFINVVLPEQEFSPILGDRFNNDSNSIPNRLPINSNQLQLNMNNVESTTRLPYDALGNKDIVDRLNRLPFDQRPFWLINAAAIENHRNQSQSRLTNETIVNQQTTESLTNIPDVNQNLNQSSENLIDKDNQDLIDKLIELNVDFDDNSTISNTESTTENELVLAENLIDIDDSTTTQEPIVIEEKKEEQEEESMTTIQPEIVEISTFAPNSAGFPNYGRIKS